MGVLRTYLSRATADIHQALHGAAPFAQIARGEITHAGYGALLRLLHRYHLGMAGACAAGAQALDARELENGHRARIARLCDDLSFLDVAPADDAREPVQGSAFSIGCLYTVLGSTLGGKVISRQLENLLPDARGRSFFAGAADDAAHWRLFCERLEICGEEPVSVEAGARHAFARFALLLEDRRDFRPEPCAPGADGGLWISLPQTG